VIVPFCCRTGQLDAADIILEVLYQLEPEHPLTRQMLMTVVKARMEEEDEKE
jgi:hypothetical protein